MVHSSVPAIAGFGRNPCARVSLNTGRDYPGGHGYRAHASNRKSGDRNLQESRRPLRISASKWSRLQRSNKSGFKGVSFYRPTRKWQAHIRVNGKVRHLGHFADIQSTARAYDEATKKYRGEFAAPNAEIRLAA